MFQPVLFAAVAALLLVLLPPQTARAGRLDLAVIQFTDGRDADAMAAALGEVDLMKITDSDRTETNVPALRGGWVVFTQSLGVASGGQFGSSTRLTNQRADVAGSLQGSKLAVKIAILEGVKVGLRKYRESIYEGNGLVGPTPQLIGLRQSKGKTQVAIKGRSKIVETNFTTIIVARYVP